MALAVVLVVVVVLTQLSGPPPRELPAAAARKLNQSLEASKRHARHVWRDTPPYNNDWTVNGYIEIPRGERRKFELDMRQNRRAIDRVIPKAVGGYPVNYGFVPQTVSYDGDPFDILVLGPPLPGGRVVRAVIVGVMHMEDGGVIDSKVVASPLRRDGQAAYQLTPADRERIGQYFSRYKDHQPETATSVPGWDDAARGRAFVDTTHAFFRQCPGRTSACRVE